MNTRLISRRRFLEATTIAATAALSAGSDAFAAGVNWPVGCFNRAWAQWPSDVALAGIRAAGYRLVGLISNHSDNPLALPAATAESLAALKQKLAASRLQANMTALRYNEDAPDEELEKSVLTQLDHSQTIGVRYVMTFGADKPANHGRYFRLMTKAAGWAAERKLQLVLKPHGGISASADEIQRCLDTVAHPNFKVWYDAGNIIHYTGKNPAKELKPIAKHVTGFCAKDCPGPGGEVMIQFGIGKVDFKEVFAVLKTAGFNGPIMVEGLKVGATPEETNGFAKANREFLEKVLREL
jgi:sugar phosphate isomerase/epimerase